jgi:hypothetical protein
MLSMSIIQVLVYAGVPSEHGILIWSEIGAKLLSRSILKVSIDK